MVAITLFELSDAEDRMTQRFSSDQVKDLLIKNDLKEALEAFGKWLFGE